MQDNAGHITYKHYIIAGSARVGVETIATTSGTVNTDTLSFFIDDQVGSVIAEVTEGEYGANQQLAIYGHDHWGKARPTSGTGANIALLPGVFQPDSAMMTGQHEGFAGHEDLEDIGIVDMEGRIYDPEVGRFLSAVPTVQYPNSSQGYNRFTYVGNNPLSLSDPTGYTSAANRREEGIAAAILVAWACSACAPEVEAMLAGAAGGYVGSGGTWSGTVEGGAEAMAMYYAGSYGGYSSDGNTAIFEKSVVEGFVGGAFSMAGGGRFSDGFLGSFTSSELGSYVDEVGGNPNSAAYHSPLHIAERVALSSIAGGAVSKLTGGSFADGAFAAAFQRLFNEEKHGAHHYSLADDGVVLSDYDKTNLDKVADEYYDQNKADLVVTSGTRTAEQQAGAMYDKLAAGDDLHVYKNQAAVGDIKQAYNLAIAAGDGRDVVISDMTKVIQTQMGNGTYISDHLTGNAVDIRSRDMTAAESASFKSIASKYGAPTYEGIPQHWHLQFNPPN